MKRKTLFLIGILLSGILGWTLGFLRLPYIEKNFSFLMGFVAALSFVFLGFIFLLIWKKDTLLTPLISNNLTASNSSNPFRKYAFIWILVTGFILLGAMTSSYFIYQQNQFSKNKIQTQLQKIEYQSAIIEANRMSGSLVMINDILEKINEEVKNNPKRKLSELTIKKLTALNFSLNPYLLLDGDSLSKEKLSPERGQLLLGLAAMNLDTSSFSQIKKEVTFSGADLKKADLKNTDLSGVDLKNANLRDADLSGAILNHADLTDANLWGVNLNHAELKEANLNRVNLEWAEVNEADLSKANLNGANLSNAKLRNTNFMEVKMGWAKLNGANLINANLTGAVLTETDFGKANLTNTNFTKATLNLTNLSNSILNQTNFSEADLNKAKIFEEDWLEKLMEWKVIGEKEILNDYKIVVDVSGAYNFRIRRKDK